MRGFWRPNIGLSNTTVAGKLKEMKGKLVKSVEEKSQKLQQMRSVGDAF